MGTLAGKDTPVHLHIRIQWESNSVVLSDNSSFWLLEYSILVAKVKLTEKCFAFKISCCIIHENQLFHNSFGFWFYNLPAKYITFLLLLPKYYLPFKRV